MLFWFVAALLTVGASLAVLLPLASRTGTDSRGESNDLEVYRDQLAELDRDAARGLIRQDEAEQARTEISRRILLADSQAKASGDKAAPPRSAMARLVSVAAILAVPLVSWGIYAGIGSPDLPSQPLAARRSKNPADSSIDELVARAEAHLVANPSDGRGWDVLAPIYLRLGRYGEAVNAYRNAIKLDGDSALRESGLGEAIAGAGGGLVSDDARAAFGRALELDPAQPKARYYLATALAQEGKTSEAVAAWQAMLATLDPGSPWHGATAQAIQQAGAEIAAAENMPPSRGPSSEQIEAAAGMSDADRNAMIETMVAGLDERLRQTPNDPEGWAKLVRSYVMLGKTDAARDALKRGVAALGADSAEAKSFSDFAATLGLSATD
jgi:cytochrome c-type biogenesis protein CcmH